MKNNHLIATRAIIQKTHDEHPIQTTQVEIFDGHEEPEVHESMPRMGEYGFTSHPVSGKVDGIVLSLGGDRTHSVVVATEDRRHRRRGLKEGEVALYDSQGQYFYLQREGKCEVKAMSEFTLSVGSAKLVLRQDGFLTIYAPSGISIQGDLEIQGNIHALEATAGQTSLTTHVHPGNMQPPIPSTGN